MLKDFFKAGFGGVASQAISLLALPIISRLYAPESYASWAIIMATAGIFGAIACFRYELAIVIPKKEEEASSILWGCAISAITTGLIVAVILQIPWLHKIIMSETVGNEWFYTLFVPVMIVTMGFNFILQYWSIRQQAYTLNSFAQIVLVIVTLILQVFWAVKYSASSLGLLIGSCGGQIASVLVLLIGIFYIGKYPQIGRHIFKAIPNVFNQYRNFFIYSTPYTLFGTARDRASIFVLGYFLENKEVGLYAFAQRIMGFLVSLVSNAIRPVLFQNAASKGIKSVENKINNILRWLAIITIPFVVLYFFYAKEIFILFFGEKWAGSGFMGKFLILPVFTFLFCNWMDRIMDVMGKQRLTMIFEVVFASASIAGLWLGFILKTGLTGALLIQCIILIMYNIVYLYIVYDKAGYDKAKLFQLLYRGIIWAIICGVLLFVLKRIASDIFAVSLYFVVISAIFWRLGKNKVSIAGVKI
jgi:O-antigen/teichoic acid export membrane protein